MNGRKLIVRIVAFLLAALMLLGVFAIILQIFAADETVLTPVVQTGSQSSPSWIIYAGLVAVLAIGLCIVLPKMLKKK